MSRPVLKVALVVLFVVTSLPLVAVAEDEPRFQMGFEMLANLIPEVAGLPLENERHNALNGDGLQMTTRGLMVWRKADNWTAFTNGWWTWVNGPIGLQDRANYERFEWEGDAATFVLSPERTPAADAKSAAYPTWTQTPAATWDSSSSPSPIPHATTTPIPEATATPITQPTVVPSPTAVPAASPTAAPTRTLVPTRIPTQTPRPTATTAPTSTPRPTSTPQPTSTIRPTATQQSGGVRSPDPAGQWVTSVSTSTRYYCSVTSTYWLSWSAANRVWFPTESALLAVYPDRVKHD